jgi:hypothetical protein
MGQCAGTFLKVFDMDLQIALQKSDVRLSLIEIHEKTHFSTSLPGSTPLFLFHQFW